MRRKTHRLTSVLGFAGLGLAMLGWSGVAGATSVATAIHAEVGDFLRGTLLHRVAAPPLRPAFERAARRPEPPSAKEPFNRAAKPHDPPPPPWKGSFEPRPGGSQFKLTPPAGFKPPRTIKPEFNKAAKG